MNNRLIQTREGKNLELVEKDFKDFAEKDWEEYFTIANQVFRETYPLDDPLPDRSSRKMKLVSQVDSYSFYTWLVLDNEKIVAYAELYHTNDKSPNYDKSKHIIQAKAAVHQDHRNQGIGTEILKRIVRRSKELGKTVLQTDVYLDTATRFIENRTGVKPAKVGDENRMYLKNVDWKMMQKWIDEGKQKAMGARIEIHQEVPDHLIDEFCQVYTRTLADEPQGELEDPFVLTPELQRKFEKQFKESGEIIENAIAIEADGSISGLTEIFFNTRDNYFGSQGLTGVLGEYRGRGLGKWLKAHLLVHMRDTYPDIKFIRAGNAGANKPMLSINHRMGFECIFHRTDYNMDIDEISKHMGI